MRELLVALGLLLAVEGLCFAAFPALVRKTAADLARASSELMRIAGVVAAILGVALLWLVRDGII